MGQVSIALARDVSPSLLRPSALFHFAGDTWRMGIASAPMTPRIVPWDWPYRNVAGAPCPGRALACSTIANAYGVCCRMRYGESCGVGAPLRSFADRRQIEDFDQLTVLVQDGARAFEAGVASEDVHDEFSMSARNSRVMSSSLISSGSVTR